MSHHRLECDAYIGGAKRKGAPNSDFIKEEPDVKSFKSYNKIKIFLSSFRTRVDQTTLRHHFMELKLSTTPVIMIDIIRTVYTGAVRWKTL